MMYVPTKPWAYVAEAGESVVAGGGGGRPSSTSGSAIYRSDTLHVYKHIYMYIFSVLPEIC